MPNIRISFLSNAGTTTYNSQDLTTEQESALINWIWAEYAPKDGSGAVLARTASNEANAFRNWCRAIVKGLISNVKAREYSLLVKKVVAPTFPEE